MDLVTWLGFGDTAGLVALASVASFLPVRQQRNRMSLDGGSAKIVEDKDDREKELGPPSYDEYIELWEGLCQVRRSDYYGLPVVKGKVTDRDVRNRVGQLCRRADWRSALEKKLINLAMKKDEGAAGAFYPGRGLPLRAKSKITAIECEKVLKYFKACGIISHGQPIFENAGHKDMLARALGARVGEPNKAIVRTDNRVVYEFYSLDVGQVLTEQGRYDLMKGCAEIRTDSKLGLAHIRIFQRWHTPVPGDDDDQQFARPHLTMDEEYEGHVFMQDDVVYALAFRVDKGSNGRPMESKSKERRNMISLVLSGYSREGDGFHRKMTGGQLGQGIGGTVGVLAAPCVFYRASPDRISDIQGVIKDRAPKAWKELNELKDKDTLNYETLKRDSRFINLMNGVPQSLAAIMADLDVPMPLPDSDEERGAQILFG